MAAHPGNAYELKSMHNIKSQYIGYVLFVNKFTDYISSAGRDGDDGMQSMENYTKLNLRYQQVFC